MKVRTIAARVSSGTHPGTTRIPIDVLPMVPNSSGIPPTSVTHIRRILWGRNLSRSLSVKTGTGSRVLLLKSKLVERVINMGLLAPQADSKFVG